MPRKKSTVPTLKEKDESVKPGDYLNDSEREHLNFIRTRCEKARDDRNAERDEFDGLGYLDAYDRDSKTALAFIEDTVNEGENPVSTGTTRQALISLVSRAMSYNYTTEFHAFGGDDMELPHIGPAVGVAVSHANYLDGDEEQSKERVAELLSHGDVIVYEDWVEELGMVKSRPKFDGKITGVTWTEEKETVFKGCRRRTVQGRRFYPGNINCPTINRQPFCFEVNHLSPNEAKLKYGHFERWANVPSSFNDSFDQSSYAEEWGFEVEDGLFTEVIYVDLPNNEMQVILNGVPMLPMGFPTKWEHGRYPWAHEGAEPIRTGFFYRRSFVRTLQNMQEIENDMWRVIIMLAWKAAIPPMANMTGQVITRRHLMAGQVNDVNPEYLKPIYDGSLQNTGFVREVASMIRQNMMSRSVPELKQGIAPPGTSTATEIGQLNREAEVAISLNLQSAANIASKSDWLRAGNLLQYAFKEGYRASADIPSMGGVARQIVEVVAEPSSSRELLNRENEMTDSTGIRPKIIQVRKDVRGMIERLEARSVPKPRRSSALEKTELLQLFQAARAIFGNVDSQSFEDMFRSAYGLPTGFKLKGETSEADLAKLQAGMSPEKAPMPTPQQLAQANTPQ